MYNSQVTLLTRGSVPPVRCRGIREQGQGVDAVRIGKSSRMNEESQTPNATSTATVTMGGNRQVRKGRDWTCVECGYVNFGSRSECKDCLLERPPPTQRGDPTSSPRRLLRGPVSLDRRSPPR
jgi:hypothetical protein